MLGDELLERFFRLRGGGNVESALDGEDQASALPAGIARQM